MSHLILGYHSESSCLQKHQISLIFWLFACFPFSRVFNHWSLFTTGRKSNKPNCGSSRKSHPKSHISCNNWSIIQCRDCLSVFIGSICILLHICLLLSNTKHGNNGKVFKLWVTGKNIEGLPLISLAFHFDLVFNTFYLKTILFEPKSHFFCMKKYHFSHFFFNWQTRGEIFIFFCEITLIKRGFSSSLYKMALKMSAGGYVLF